MKQEMHDAIYTLAKKAKDLNDADACLKMAQAALCLANAAETLENLELDTPAETAKDPATQGGEATPPADPVAAEDALQTGTGDTPVL